MTRDRLKELQVRYKVIDGGDSANVQTDNVEFLDPVLQKIGGTSSLLDEISSNIEKIKACQLRIISSPTVNPKDSALLDEHMNTVRVLTNQVRVELKGLEDKGEKEKLLSNGIDRMQKLQHAALVKRFLLLMESYNNNQLEYREKCKSRIRLQLKVACTDVTDDAVENMLESENPCVFTEAIMQKTTAAKQSLMEIEARHADILKLEKSIQELRDMFAHISLLVDQQGDLIDNIEHNVQQTVDKVEEAKVAVIKAVETQKKTRKKKIICYTILAVLVLILIISIASVLGLR